MIAGEITTRDIFRHWFLIGHAFGWGVLGHALIAVALRRHTTFLELAMGGDR